MSDRLELAVHDFLIEGRDVAKSHVLLEIAAPAPEELNSRGHFIALAELSGASPKTIQLAKAWIEFAIETYFATTQTDTESHFETILNQLNTQSSVYLRQHTNETIHMLVAVVCGTNLYMAFHGSPSAILLYRKADAWVNMNLSGGESGDLAPPGQLFGNIVSGTIRPDDRILIATPHVTEFFTSDRLSKISEGKTFEEAAEHMERVIHDLSSDVSFAAVWLKLVRVIEHEELPASSPVVAVGQKTITHSNEKKSYSSMTQLLAKTRTTAALLAPPVISIPRDKIITSLLQLIRNACLSVSSKFLRTTRTCVAFARAHKGKVADKSFSFKFDGFFKNFKQSRIFIALSVVLVLIGVLGFLLHRSSLAKKIAETTKRVQEKIVHADSAFTYQNETDARALIIEAETILKTLDVTTPETRTLAARFLEEKNKIFHSIPVEPELIIQNNSIKQIFYVNGSYAFLGDAGHIQSIKNGKTVDIGVAADAKSGEAYLDEDSKRFLVRSATDTKKFSAISLTGGNPTPITITTIPENNHIDAAYFYSGRAYVYDGAATMLYRYEKTDSGYSNGKNWIVDNTKPVHIVRIVADTSLWLQTLDGGVLKFTAGKLQPFHFTNIVPEIKKTDLIITTASGNSVYFLDTEHNRLVATDRDGKLIKQFLFPDTVHFTSVALDKNETAAAGITNDGRLMKFLLTK